MRLVIKLFDSFAFPFSREKKIVMKKNVVEFLPKSTQFSIWLCCIYNYTKYQVFYLNLLVFLSHSGRMGEAVGNWVFEFVAMIELYMNN